MASRKHGVSVTVLGSGCCIPSLDRSSCSVLIEMDGSKLMFDAGSGSMRRLMEAGATIYDISFMFFSHFHPDHTGELSSFLFSTKYANDNRRTTPLTIVAGKGFAGFFNDLKKVYGDWILLPQDLLHVVEMDNKAFDFHEFGNFKVESIPVEHNEESIAYRVTGSGVSVVYSGDTDSCDNLVDLAGDADLFICESAFPDEFKKDGHLTPSLAGKIAARANVRRLLLTHFYPECETVDIEKECRKTYKGRLELAKDLMKIEL